MRVATLINNNYENEAEKVNLLNEQQNNRQLYGRAKTQKTRFVKYFELQIDPNTLAKHVEAHFKTSTNSPPIPETLSNPPKEIRDKLRKLSEDFPINNTIPTKNEVRKVILKLNDNKKSSDADREIFKTACEDETFFQNVYQTIKTSFEDEITPESWRHGTLTAIHKKGNKNDAKNYRGLNLSSVIRTVVTKICINRMSDWYEHPLHDKQNGFRQNYSTSTGVLTNKLVHNIVNKKKQMTFLLFVDLTTAFDKLNRDFLWKTIKLRFKPGTNTKVINLLDHLYSSTSAEIKGNESLVLNIQTGVFQGGPESPILYNLFMDYVMRLFMLKSKEESVNFISHSYSIPKYASSTGTEVTGETHISWSGYADDISRYLSSIKDLQTASRILDQVFGHYQLIINYKKTETMILNYLDTDTSTSLT